MLHTSAVRDTFTLKDLELHWLLIGPRIVNESHLLNTHAHTENKIIQVEQRDEKVIELITHSGPPL